MVIRDVLKLIAIIVVVTGLLFFCFASGLAGQITEINESYRQSVVNERASEIRSCMDRYRFSEETCARMLFGEPE